MYERYSAPFLFLVLLTTAIYPLSVQFETNRTKFWREIIIFLMISIGITSILVFQKNTSFIEELGFWVAIFLIVIWTNSLLSQFMFYLSKDKNDFASKGRSLNYGSTLIHIGLGLMAVGIMGQETLSESYELRLDIRRSRSDWGFHN